MLGVAGDEVNVSAVTPGRAGSGAAPARAPTVRVYTLGTRPVEAEVTAPVRLTVAGLAELSEPEAVIEPGGHIVRDLTLTGSAVGRVLRVRADCAVPGIGSAEDGVVLGARHGPLALVADPRPVTLAPGGQGEVTVELRTRTFDPVPAGVVALSPFDSWHLVPEPVVATVVRPGTPCRVSVPVRVPAAARSGRWWVMLVVRCLDQVLYSRAVRLHVLAR